MVAQGSSLCSNQASCSSCYILQAMDSPGFELTALGSGTAKLATNIAVEAG